jgi:hypothetical protein
MNLHRNNDGVNMTTWQPFEEGHTLGRTGAEGGEIVLDDEHPGGARITLERGCLRAPFAITCGVYGWLVHTRFVADEETAQHAVAAMKDALAAIVALIPPEDAPDEAERLAAAAAAAADFAEQFT